MSTSVLPTLKGLGWPVVRTAMWNTGVQRSISGKRTAVAFQAYPLYQWELTYNYLMADSVNLDMQTLLAFFNSLQGQLDTFLYEAPDDNSVTGQNLGTGDGVTTDFQLVRAMVGVGYSYVEPILAPKHVSTVYVNGVAVSGSAWTVSSWGSATPGVITFTPGNVPPVGQAVTADFTFYWPVALTDDSLELNAFLSQIYKNPSLKFMSVK